MENITTPMKYLLPVFCAGATLLTGILQSHAAATPSQWVYPSVTDNLLYAADTNGVRINDFSDCGYKRGGVALPQIRDLVPEQDWIRLTPRSNGRDNAAMINNALAAAGARSPNAHGFRGVVFLEAGDYRIDRTVLITNSGVVLKGAGNSLTSGTRIRPTFQLREDAIYVGICTNCGYGPGGITNLRTHFSEPLVPAGTRTFRVQDASAFAVGDLVLIRHRAHPRWISDLDMDQLGGLLYDLAELWDGGSLDQLAGLLVQAGFSLNQLAELLEQISSLKPREDLWFERGTSTGEYERKITRIDHDWITIDSPLPQTFESKYGGGEIEPLDVQPRVENCGVEDLACVFKTDLPGFPNSIPDPLNPMADDDRKPEAAVHVSHAIDIWMRNVTAAGYFSSCVLVDGRTKFVTVAESQMLHAADSIHHDRYAFYLRSEAAFVLMRDCFSQHSRHDYVTGSAVPGPNAFVRCRTSESDDDTGPHERWATGVLFDNLSVDESSAWVTTAGELNVQNRGNSGGGHSHHGWTGAYVAVWNCYAEGGFRVRNPPTARNWLIGGGSDGDIMRSKWPVGADPEGTYDHANADTYVQLRSLYYAQLQQKLKWPGSEFREHRLGDIDQLSSKTVADVSAPLDADWLAQVRAAAGSAPVRNWFDDSERDAWKAFTINFTLAPGERVVAASLTLGLQYNGGPFSFPTSERLYLDSTNTVFSFGSLGWHPTKTGGTSHTMEVDPGLLQDGRLNIALNRNCGVDHATLYLQVSRAVTFGNSTRVAVADTYVRDGDYANQSFAAENELWVKKDSDDGFHRKSILKWNLAASFPGQLADARVRLFCKDAGQAGNEQMAYVVTDDAWAASTLTWNAFRTWPVDKPMAYWTPTPGRFVEFSVLPEVAAALAGDGVLSIALEAAQNWGDAGWVTYASTEDPDPSHRPSLVLQRLNRPPTIVAPTHNEMTENSTLGPLTVTIGDAETSATPTVITPIKDRGGPITLPNGLTLTAKSSNPSAITSTNIILGGTGSNRTVTLRTLPHQQGVTTISLQVSDGAQTNTASFVVKVRLINSPPTLDPIAGQTMSQGTSRDVRFSVWDSTSASGVLLAHSSNPVLFPEGSLRILTTQRLIPLAGVHTLRMVPAAGRSGSALITVSASDGQFIATSTFTVTVTPNTDLADQFAIISQHQGDVLTAGTPVAITAYVPNTSPARVTFYAGSQRLGSVASAPYSLTWSNPPLGMVNLWAIAAATDGSGLIATSAPVSITFTTEGLKRPSLQIVSREAEVLVHWQPTLGQEGFILESCTEANPSANWIAVESTVEESNGVRVAIFPASAERRFFRLRRQ